MLMTAARRLLKPLKYWQMRRRTAEDVFTEIYKKRIWGGDDEHFSGFGSHIEPAISAYVESLTKFAKSHADCDVVDIGCGDFNMGSRVRHLFGRYTACDVVPHLIERNKSTFSDMGVDFRHLDITTQQPPQADVALVRQVLQHLSNEQIKAALHRLMRFKFLIITEHLPIGAFKPNLDKPPGAGVRAYEYPPSGVVITEAPFLFPVKSMTVLGEMVADDQILRTTLYES